MSPMRQASVFDQQAHPKIKWYYPGSKSTELIEVLFMEKQESEGFMSEPFQNYNNVCINEVLLFSSSI